MTAYFNIKKQYQQALYSIADKLYKCNVKIAPLVCNYTKSPAESSTNSTLNN